MIKSEVTAGICPPPREVGGAVMYTVIPKNGNQSLTYLTTELMKKQKLKRPQNDRKHKSKTLKKLIFSVPL
jgi:hypothetical protein